jgi:hypothetical protein
MTNTISGEPMKMITPVAPIATPLAIHQAEPYLSPITISATPYAGRISDTTSRRIQLIDS